MRKHDPQLQEDGFALVREVASDHIGELLAEYRAEVDHGLKCWLLELIGEVRSVEALPLLSEALTDTDESIRQRARVGLRLLGTKEARTQLWQDRSNEPPA